jgi:hypothetical protein
MSIEQTESGAEFLAGPLVSYEDPEAAEDRALRLSGAGEGAHQDSSSSESSTSETADQDDDDSDDDDSDDRGTGVRCP